VTTLITYRRNGQFPLRERYAAVAAIVDARESATLGRRWPSCLPAQPRTKEFIMKQLAIEMAIVSLVSGVDQA
jgi:hypothetical protein